MASCEAKTHNLQHGANVTKMFALSVPQRVESSAKVYHSHSTWGLQPVTPDTGDGL